MKNKAIVKTQNHGFTFILKNQNGYRENKFNIRCPEQPDDLWKTQIISGNNSVLPSLFFFILLYTK